MEGLILYTLEEHFDVTFDDCPASLRPTLNECFVLVFASDRPLLLVTIIGGNPGGAMFET